MIMVKQNKCLVSLLYHHWYKQLTTRYFIDNNLYCAWLYCKESTSHASTHIVLQ